MASTLREHLVAYFQEHQKLVEAGALELLLDHSHPLVVSREVIERSGSVNPFVTREMVETVLAEDRGSGPLVRAPTERPPGPRDAPPGAATLPFRLIQDGYSGPPSGDTPLLAYSALFHFRYRSLLRLLKGRSGTREPAPDQGAPHVRRDVVRDRDGPRRAGDVAAAPSDPDGRAATPGRSKPWSRRAPPVRG